MKIAPLQLEKWDLPIRSFIPSIHMYTTPGTQPMPGETRLVWHTHTHTHTHPSMHTSLDAQHLAEELAQVTALVGGHCLY